MDSAIDGMDVTTTRGGDNGSPQAEPREGPSKGSRSLLSDLANLTKVRISIVLVFVMLATLVAAGGPVEPGPVTLLSLICLLATTGASVLNNYIDRDIDVKMSRTRARPLPGNRITPGQALTLGIALSVAALGLSAAFMTPLISLLVFAGWFHYVVVYTLLLKRRTVTNIILGGWAGAYAPLTGWVMVKPIGLAPVIMALIIFLWTPIHFWSLSIGHASDYRRSRVPMLPVVHGEREASRYILLSAVPLLASVIVLPWSGLDASPLVLFVVSLLIGVAIVMWCYELYRNPVAEKGLVLYRRSNVAIFLLFLALAVGTLLT
jgi:protoheme IX farnesyltransferase